MMKEQELLNLKNEIEQSKEDISKLKGRQEALLEQLSKQYGIKTIAAAKKKIKQLEAGIEEKQEAIQAKTVELEDKINARSTDTEEPS